MSPTNPFLKTVDINRVSNHYKKLNSNCIVVVDNTWASPLYQSPCNLGADISLHSATKYISGHSDVMGGVILTNDLKIDELIRTRRFYTGANLDPHSAWLLRRSLHTLDIRLEKQGKTTKKIISFLETRNEIDKVYYPDIDGIQMVDYATLLFFDFRKDLVSKYSIFSQKLQLFSTGTGMACVTSMVAQPFTGSHASMDSIEKESMGLSLSTIRLSFGLEDPNDLITDIENALNLSELCKRRFRSIAQISGLMMQGFPGKNKSSGQLQISGSLLWDVFNKHEPQNLLLRQSRFEVLNEQLELPRLKKALQRIRKGDIIHSEIVRPGPLAFPLLVERLRSRLSNESILERVTRMQNEALRHER